MNPLSPIVCVAFFTYVHMDLPSAYAYEVKRELAKRIGEIYADVMQTTADLVNVTYRELGDGNVWSCNAAVPVSAAVISVECRRGCPLAQREALCRQLMAIVTQVLNLDPVRTVVEMTQHPGDENYLERYVDGQLNGSLGRDWAPDKASVSLVEKINSELRAARAAQRPED